MVTVTSNYSSARHRASVGEGYDGVVRVSTNGYYGSGVLLYDGRAVLTAAHLFSHGGTASTMVHLETLSGTQSIAASRVLLNPNYDSVNISNDLALVWLSSSAPTDAERYDLYRDADELGQSFAMVGYGLTGIGATGAIASAESTPVRHIALNRFEAMGEDLLKLPYQSISWRPLPGTQLIADFDSGTVTNDALGALLGLTDTGLGSDEGVIAQGDSGGPAFINGQLAGIASYTTSLSTFSASPDVNNAADSSFGEVAAWQRVSTYQQWIDQSLRASYPDAPERIAEVKKEVAEGNSGVHYAYFMLSFSGTREAADTWISVDYRTRDGTATAGEDYLATAGTLILYPDELQAVIPVEIIADQLDEPNETFYLDISNPVGGTFSEGVITLTAVRTIVDDDALLA